MKVFLLTSIIFLFVMTAGLGNVFAQTTAGAGADHCEEDINGQKIIVPCDPLKFTRPDDDGKGLPDAIGRIVKFPLMLLGAGAFLMLLYGGAKIMFSRGEPQMVASGKKIITFAVIGLTVIFLAYAVLSFVLSIASPASV